ncbi:MAG: sulfotransferase, partial [Euzebyales bacterium]|nr:sulfotransferase [Euzebyales bacterium]
SERAALGAVFPHCRYVHVRRRDVDRQAVSWAVAEATGRWGDRGEGDRPPEVAYDFKAIEDCRRRIVAGDACWRALFRAVDTVPLEVVYEDLVADYRATVAAVAAYLGVALRPSQVSPPRLRQQAGEGSERLVARYRSDRHARGD